MLGVAKIPERLVRSFDDFQQERRWLAQPIGTIRKYADDRGSALAGLLTFQVFLGMLPLLVVALTVFGRLLESNNSLKEAVLDSTLVQFPVIGGRLKDNVSALGVRGPWVWITLAGLVWTATGIYNVFQLALNQVWNVVGVDRQGLISRLVRSALLFVLVFAAAIGTSFLGEAAPYIPGPAWLRRIVIVVVGVLIASGLLLAVFRIATAPSIPTSNLLPAALVAGVLWQALQRLGSWIITDRLSSAEDLYGAIGFVVVALFWINLLARSVLFANELAVVGHRRLWPRRIAQPPLTDADKKVLRDLLQNEIRRPEERVTVTFDGGDADSDDPDGSG